MTDTGREITGASASTELATFGGGCFWCLEPVFDALDGVLDVVSGYSGGHVPDPRYEDVCAGTTGHAEVVQVTFDPRRITFRDLVELFFGIHDPTTLNRQGNDIGTQYRSAVYVRGPEQEAVTRQVIAALDRQKLWARPIVTEVTPFAAFYPAEEHHQEYFARNPFQPYCLLVIRPKVAKFRKQHLDRLKKRSA